jgi:hypothetical protein
MNKSENFTRELCMISDDKIRELTKDIINKLPDYFFNVAASSTGKYHPSYALGTGGLVRHTKAAVRIADELFRMEMFKPLLEDKDYIISALILHDGLKHGKTHSAYTVADHPVQAAEFIKENYGDKEIGEKIANLVLTHMGQWNTDYRSGAEIMPKPSTKTQNFVHLCDYLASRKCLEFNFSA